MEVRFRRKFPWAILPYPAAKRAESGADEDGVSDADGFSEFRWLRREFRSPHWAMRKAAESVGWIIPSPIDVTVRPLSDAELAVTPEERATFSRPLGWESYHSRIDHKDARELLIFSDKVPWIASARFLSSIGWSDLFVPLGDGFIEWGLGWEARATEGSGLLLLPHENTPDIGIESGIMLSSSMQVVNNDAASAGIALAVRPRRSVRIQRGQPIARALFLHPDAIRCKCSQMDGAPIDVQVIPA